MEPTIILDGMDIDDGNNNGMIESGELASLTVAIQNIGLGDAKDVNIKVEVGKNVFFGGDSKKEFYFKIIPVGKMKKFTLMYILIKLLLKYLFILL